MHSLRLPFASPAARAAPAARSAPEGRSAVPARSTSPASPAAAVVQRLVEACVLGVAVASGLVALVANLMTLLRR